MLKFKFQKEKNDETLLQELFELDNNKVLETTIACQTFLLRLPVHLFRKLRNFKSHQTMNSYEQLENGNYNNSSLRYISWKKMLGVFHFANNCNSKLIQYYI